MNNTEMSAVYKQWAEAYAAKLDAEDPFENKWVTIAGVRGGMLDCVLARVYAGKTAGMTATQVWDQLEKDFNT